MERLNKTIRAIFRDTFYLLSSIKPSLIRVNQKCSADSENRTSSECEYLGSYEYFNFYQLIEKKTIILRRVHEG